MNCQSLFWQAQQILIVRPVLVRYIARILPMPARYTVALTSREQDQFVRLLAKSTGDAKIGNIGHLAREHLVTAIAQIATMAEKCIIPELRLKAALSLVELSKLNAPDDDFTGDTAALTALAELPQVDQRTAALKMFAEGQIGRKDLDTVLKILDSGQALQVMYLTQHTKYLEDMLEKRNAKEARLIEGSTNGHSHAQSVFPGLSSPVPPIPPAPPDPSRLS